MASSLASSVEPGVGGVLALVLSATCGKVQQMASTPREIFPAAKDKIAEFRRLRYPLSVLLLRKLATSSVLAPVKACGSLYGTYSGERKTVQRPVIRPTDHEILMARE
jgi:hypothetical protein